MVCLHHREHFAGVCVEQQHEEAGSAGGNGVNLHSREMLVRQGRGHVVEREPGLEKPLARLVGGDTAVLSSKAGLDAFKRLLHWKEFLHIFFSQK